MIGGPSELLVRNERFDQLLPPVILAILAGPSVAGLLLTGFIGGFRNIKTNLIRKINLKWYVVVLLSAPVLVCGIYSVLSLFSPEFIPALFASKNKIAILIPGLMTGLAAGLFEEIGWTGFVIPNLRKRYNILKVGLIVGLLWAFWHTLPGAWMGYGSGTVTSLSLLISYFADSFLFLVIYRVLMVWVYDKTESLPLAMVMHGSLTASARIFVPIGIVGIPLLIFDLVWFFILSMITIFIFKFRWSRKIV